MSEPVRLAKLAREHLASALNTLQSEDNIPDELMDTADPIAEAMSALHRIERSGGAELEGREVALRKVRAALDSLVAPIERAFAAARERGEVEFSRMPHRERLLAASFLAIVDNARVAERFARTTAMDMVESMIDVLLNGLRPR
jgi:hypothetical protein